jgi:hypothetical protein
MGVLKMATKVVIGREGYTSDAVWTEVDTGKEYYDHGSRQALLVFGDDLTGTHEISDDLAYCLFSEE